MGDIWEGLGVRSETTVITKRSVIHADGCYQVKIYNQGNRDAFVSINDNEPLIFTNPPTSRTFSNFILLEGEPYLKRYDKIEISIEGDLTDATIYVIRDFVVPVTKGDKKTVYEVNQG